MGQPAGLPAAMPASAAFPNSAMLNMAAAQMMAPGLGIMPRFS
jgi:hypothetical protein